MGQSYLVESHMGVDVIRVRCSINAALLEGEFDTIIVSSFHPFSLPHVNLKSDLRCPCCGLFELQANGHDSGDSQNLVAQSRFCAAFRSMTPQLLFNETFRASWSFSQSFFLF